MKKLVPYLLVLLTMFSGAAIAGDDKPLDAKKLVVFIKTADVMEAGMGLSLSHSAVKKGAKVTVVLGANAALYPTKNGGKKVFPAKGKTLSEMLKMVVADGGTVYLCSLCAKHQGLKQEDLINGVEIVKSIKIFNALFENGAASMSY